MAATLGILGEGDPPPGLGTNEEVIDHWRHTSRRRRADDEEASAEDGPPPLPLKAS